jgi:hypothetical protein
VHGKVADGNELNPDGKTAAKEPLRRYVPDFAGNPADVDFARAEYGNYTCAPVERLRGLVSWGFGAVRKKAPMGGIRLVSTRLRGVASPEWGVAPGAWARENQDGKV